MKDLLVFVLFVLPPGSDVSKVNSSIFLYLPITNGSSRAAPLRTSAVPARSKDGGTADVCGAAARSDSNWTKSQQLVVAASLLSSAEQEVKKKNKNANVF